MPLKLRADYIGGAADRRCQCHPVGRQVVKGAPGKRAVVSSILTGGSCCPVGFALLPHHALHRGESLRHYRCRRAGSPNAPRGRAGTNEWGQPRYVGGSRWREDQGSGCQRCQCEAPKHPFHANIVSGYPFAAGSGAERSTRPRLLLRVGSSMVSSGRCSNRTLEFKAADHCCGTGSEPSWLKVTATVVSRVCPSRPRKNW